MEPKVKNFNNEKQRIINAVKNDETNMEIIAGVDDYLNKYPGDTDIIIVKAYMELINDNVEHGIELLKFVLEKCPFSIDALFLIGQAYNELGEYYNAMNCLGIAERLDDWFYLLNREYVYLFYNNEICVSLLDNVREKLAYLANIVPEQKQLLEKFELDLKNNFWLFKDIVRMDDEIIGNYFCNEMSDIHFCAIYDPYSYLAYKKEYPKNLQLLKTEMLKPLKSGTNIELRLKSESLVPILNKEKLTQIEIKQNNDNSVLIPEYHNMHFNYFKMKKGNIKISSDKELIVAEPVPLVHHKNNKKLVISLFVDGISQKVLKEYGLENIMPNTYNFFKNGMICNNTFSSSDWTYPSVGSLMSGLSVTNHMMIHPYINVKFPKNQKLLFEYFKEAGYHTTLMSGDWRSTSATYDATRGVDRYIAKHQNCGFRTEDVISNVIDHLETFNGTDEYVWVGTGDLHDIADEYSLPTDIQAKMDLEEFNIGKKSKTSVKQEYNINKISMYVKTATHIDSKLKVLYDYIEENYKEDEFVVTLFGDHGQAYIVKPTEFHLSRGMTNIGFMTRGGGVSGVSDEYINIVDYTNIITKLAGMENVNIDSDGRLPKTFGGDRENDFAISETIHPGDPYMIAMHGSEYTFYMESDASVTDYGKVDLSVYNTKLYDSDGNEVFDKSIIDKFVDFVLDRTKYIQIY